MRQGLGLPGRSQLLQAAILNIGNSFLCQDLARGWYKEALKMCGAKNVVAVEEECRAKGGSCCRYRFQWKQ